MLFNEVYTKAGAIFKIFSLVCFFVSRFSGFLRVVLLIGCALGKYFVQFCFKFCIVVGTRFIFYAQKKEEADARARGCRRDARA